MKQTWETILHWRTMKRNYFKKLRELQTYGNENRNPQRVAETKESIRVLSRFIYQSYKK